MSRATPDIATQPTEPNAIAEGTLPELAFLAAIEDSYRHERRGHGRILAAAGLALTGIVTLSINPNGAPGLMERLAASDAQVVIDKAIHNSSTSPMKADDLETTFGVGGGLYKANLLGPYASAWNQSLMVNALYVQSLLEGKTKPDAAYQQALDASNNYWGDQPLGFAPGFDPKLTAFKNEEAGRFVDDNLWMGLIYARDYTATGDKQSLKRAERIFSLATSQWDAKDGGIYWKEQLPMEIDHSRNVVSNAPAVRLGVELYQATGNNDYLQWSKEIFAWLKDTLQDPKTGLYNDHIDNEGNIYTEKWTYVQGIMAGAMAALSEVDPIKYPLQDAVDLARRSIDFFSNRGGNAEPAFVAICYANFLDVAARYGDPAFTKEVRTALTQEKARLPKFPSTLEDAAGVVTVIMLSKLPTYKYGFLFY